MHQANQIFYFKEGLHSRGVMNKIVEEKPTSLAEAIQIANQWEHTYRSMGNNRFDQAGAFRPGGSTSTFQSRSSSSGSVPMELSAVTEAEVQDSNEFRSEEDYSSHPAGELFATVEELSKQVASFSSSRFESSLSSSTDHSHVASLAANRIPNRSAADIQRCRHEGLCIKCLGKRHFKKDCTKLVCLKF